jgi:predicted NAD/FAD-binding protein
MKRLAIIGTGIAGMGCAHFLHRRFALTVYEKNGYAGGHSDTISVAEANRSVPIDTGFMVFNEVTYPNLTRLFRELEVAVKPAPMSFSVGYCAHRGGLRRPATETIQVAPRKQGPNLPGRIVELFASPELFL